MKKRKCLCWLLGLALLLSGCGSSQTENATNTQTDAAQGDTVPTTVSVSQMFSDSDLEIGYDDVTSAHITLSGTTAACDSDAAQISGSQITLTEEGTYILSGSLEDGMVIVDGEDSAKVHLVLDNVQIGCSTSAAIYVRNADKVFITTAPDSQNTLSNGGEFVIVSSGDCIDSNGSLTINGGTIDLTCNGNGDTALDCDGTYANNGGTLTTNDGSENNPGQMGGQPGGMGGRPGGMGGGPGGMGGQPGGQGQSGTGET